MKEFETVWADLQRIAGQYLDSHKPLATLERNTENYITEVTHQYIERDSAGKRTGSAYRVRKSDFKRIYDALSTSNGKAEVKKIGTLYFAYALYAQLPEVTFTEDPLTLHWRSQDAIEYFLIGSKYGENADVSKMEDMLDNKVVSVGFYTHSLAHYFLRPEKEIISYLRGEGEMPKSYNAVSKFLQLKPGDMVAIKSTGSPKGKTPYLAISAYAMVVERNGLVYSFDHDNLGHCINVEFVESGLNREFSLGGYGRTIHKIEDTKLIEMIFGSFDMNDSKKIRQKIKLRRRKAAAEKRTVGQFRKGSVPYVTDPRHNTIQQRFYESLVRTHGINQVSMEENWVDITLDLRDHLVLYEVKPFDEAEHCIKAALGQLIGYGFHSPDNRRKKLVIVGPSSPDDEEVAFLKHIQKNIGLDVDYLPFPI